MKQIVVKHIHFEISEEEHGAILAMQAALNAEGNVVQEAPFSDDFKAVMQNFLTVANE